MFGSNELQGKLCQFLPSGGNSRKLASDLDFLREFFTFHSVPEVHELITKDTRGVIPLPRAGPLLLSWVGLLGQRELLVEDRKTALPRSSSSAQCSRAGDSHCS